MRNYEEPFSSVTLFEHVQERPGFRARPFRVVLFCHLMTATLLVAAKQIAAHINRFMPFNVPSFD